jgi:AraC-like DNA-binding protein
MKNSLNSSSDFGFASVPAVKQYLRTAEACGVDYRTMLTSVNIDPAILANNNQRIPGSAMEQLLALVIPASKDPCFGLHSAQWVEPATYSVLGYISMNGPTLRETLANTANYEKIVGDMGTSSTIIEKGYVLQRWDCQYTNAQVKRHVVENVLGSWQIYSRNFLHLDTGLADCVWLEHKAPHDQALIEDYRDVFGCEVQFDQPVNGIRFREELLDYPVPQADKKLLRTLLAHATEVLAEIDQDQSISFQVKNLLRLTLKEQEPNSTQIAESLNMSSRTLQRKLNAENSNYKNLLNQVRLDMALYYLENTTLSLDQISYELGYAETRSFYRSFKQWTGRTAGSYRTPL